MSGPNPIKVFLSIRRARKLRRPAPSGTRRVDHSALDPILTAVDGGGVAALAEMQQQQLDDYIAALQSIDPDDLDPDEALAFWLNLYNAGTLRLAGRTFAQGLDSVLRVDRGFSAPIAHISGEDLTLDGIEHGKIRRFGDPRIHGALVCGSASCPTLRFEAYRGELLDKQLDDQMRHFLTAGAAQLQGDRLLLSRVFLWYGADFVRPRRMPTLLPATRRSVAFSLIPWLEETTCQWLTGGRSRIGFQKYDWSLQCAVRPRYPS